MKQLSNRLRERLYERIRDRLHYSLGNGLVIGIDSRLFYRFGGKLYDTIRSTTHDRLRRQAW